MAKRATAPEQFAREVVDHPVTDEMRDSFVPYALSVTTARAIPDVRDGLKPVQRRILYAMDDMGLRPANPRKKSANVVGSVMANYHPHGDGAIYEAMVRLGQTFAMSVPLVDPQGNFGSLDDPPAASRYTEARLAAVATELIGEIDEDTVDVRPTYDGERDEPVVLPARLPNLLVNGASGIAVGMATNMAPHHLGEVVSAIELVMTQRRPKPTVDELMARLPGPDFPGGGIVIDDGGIREAYETGRGSIRVRARASIEPVTARRQAIVVTELPYLVGPERLVSKVTELVKAGRLDGVAGVQNLSDRNNPLRVVIECRADADPQRLLAELFRLTPMEETFAVNAVALVDGVPQTLPLYDLCRSWVDHRLEVVVRRTEFRLARARDRAHIVEGLLIALDAIDQVIAIIRGSTEVGEARERLMAELDLSEVQATHILDMQLRRLTALEITRLREELAELQERIAEYERLLGSEQRRRTLVLKELTAVADEFGGQRRSEIMPVDEIPSLETLTPTGVGSGELDLADAACHITLSTSGLVGRFGADADFGGKPGRHDVLIDEVETTTRSTVYAVTDRGRVLSVGAGEVPEVAGRSRGASATEMFALARGERLVGLLGPPTEPVAVVTRSGQAKRVGADGITGTRSGNPLINLKGNDRVVAAFPAPDGSEVVMVAGDGQVLRTAADGISVQGPGAAGVAGMKLKGDVHVVAAGGVDFGTVAATVTDEGRLKVTDTAEIPAKGRATGGVRVVRFGGFESTVAYAWVGRASDVAAVVEGADGRPDPTPVRLDLEPTKRDGAAQATEQRILTLGLPRHG